MPHAFSPARPRLGQHVPSCAGICKFCALRSSVGLKTCDWHDCRLQLVQRGSAHACPIFSRAAPAATYVGFADIQYEFEDAGKVLHVSRDYKARCALVEFDRCRPWAVW